MRLSNSPPPFPNLSSALPVDEADESGVHPVGSLRPPANSARETIRPGEDDEDESRKRSLAPTLPPPGDDDLDPDQRLTPVDEVPAADRYREVDTDPAPSSEEALQLVSKRDHEATRPAPATKNARIEGAKKLPSIPGLRRTTSAPVSSGKRARQSLDALIDAMKRSFAEGDFEGAHRWATEVLEREPGHPGAANYVETCSRVLEQRVLGRIGDLGRVPVVLMTDAQIRWLALDHRAGFLLSMIDGFTTLEELLDIAGMPRNDVLRTMGELLDQGVIGVR